MTKEQLNKIMTDLGEAIFGEERISAINRKFSEEMTSESLFNPFIYCCDVDEFQYYGKRLAELLFKDEKESFWYMASVKELEWTFAVAGYSLYKEIKEPGEYLSVHIVFSFINDEINKPGTRTPWDYGRAPEKSVKKSLSELFLPLIT